MNLKKLWIMGIAGVGIFTLANGVVSNAHAEEETSPVVFSPKSNEEECEDPSHCVYYSEDGLLVFVFPASGSMK